MENFIKHKCGEDFFAAKKIIDLLLIDAPSMFFSGAFILYPKTHHVIQSEALEVDDVNSITSFCAQDSLYLELYTQTSYFVQKHHEEFTPIHVEYLYKSAEESDLRTLASTQEILKAGVIVRKGEEQAVLKKFQDKFPHLETVVAYGAAHPDIAFLNLVSKNATRKNALTQLCQELEVSPSECMAFGDGSSDITFLKECGCGVAMGNATDDVKASADYVTKHVEENGVAYALQRLVLQETQVVH